MSQGQIIFVVGFCVVGYVLYRILADFLSGLCEARDNVLRTTESERPADRARRDEPPPPPPERRPWHEVLEVPADANFDTVKAAYRRLILEYHPDRVTCLGADIRDLANARACEINAAYEVACRLFCRE